MVDATVCHRRDFYLSAKEAAYKAGQLDAGMDANESLISRYAKPELMTDGKLDIQKIILELMGAEIAPLQYHAEMVKYYEAGKNGQSIQSVVDATDAKLTQDMKKAAYAAGLQDGGKLTSDSESGIVKTAIPLSSRYVNSHDSLHDNSAKIKPIDGFEDIVIHGNPTGFALFDIDKNIASEYTPREFVELLREDPNYHGGNIRLLSCEAGSDNGFAAQYIANALGVKVLAPTKTLWIYPDGTFTIGTTETALDGEMKLFYPKGVKHDYTW